jgi:hypothetical protein
MSNYKENRSISEYYCIEGCGRKITKLNLHKGSHRCFQCNKDFLFFNQIRKRNFWQNYYQNKETENFSESKVKIITIIK